MDGATIRLFADADVDGSDANNLIGETTVSGNTWSIDFTDALSSGVVGLRAVHVDAAGNVSNAGYGQVVVNLEVTAARHLIPLKIHRCEFVERVSRMPQ